MGAGSGFGARWLEVQHVANDGEQPLGLEGPGEHVHGAELVREAVRRAGSVAHHEDEARAQLGGAGARLAVEVAPVEVVEVQIAEHSIDRGQGGEAGESARATRLDLDLDFVRVEEGGNGAHEGGTLSTRRIRGELPGGGSGEGSGRSTEPRLPQVLGACSGFR